MSDITDAQIDAFIDVWQEEAQLPYIWSVNVSDYLHDGMTAAEREDAIESMKAADDEAEQRLRGLVRRALDAATSTPDQPLPGDGR